MRRRVLILVTVSALALAAPATADLDPQDFEVDFRTVSGAPTIGTPTCTPPAADGSRMCTASVAFSGTGQSLSATVRQKSTGRSGTLSGLCDLSFQGTSTARVAKGSFFPEVTELSGSGSQSCSWHLSLPGASATGTATGSASLGLASPTSARISGTLSVNVVAGTGAFAGQVGTGTLTESLELPLYGGYSPRSLQGPTGAGSQLTLQLRKGRTQARITFPGATLTALADGGLRVVTAPGATCRATAVHGARTVALGRAGDPNRDGLVVVAKRLRPKLAAGVWKLSATCAFKGGTATARSVVSVS